MPAELSIATSTIRLPDDKQERLKALARSNSSSVNRLMAELATVARANYVARVRFETHAARGDPQRALDLLDKLDRTEWSGTFGATRPVHTSARTSVLA